MQVNMETNLANPLNFTKLFPKPLIFLPKLLGILSQCFSLSYTYNLQLQTWKNDRFYLKKNTSTNARKLISENIWEPYVKVISMSS